MRSLATAVLALSIPVCLGGLTGCKPKSQKVLPATLPAVELPKDDLEAGQALGKAAVTEKDPVKLAATLVAFLDRIHVPVVSQKGDKLLAHGAFTPGQPGQLWFWEPVLVGIARATVAGDRHTLGELMVGFGHPGDPKRLHEVALGLAMKEIAAAAHRTAAPVFGPIAEAIVEDLTERQELRDDPKLDPVVSLLLGVMLVVEAHVEKASPPPAPPSASPSSHAAPHLPYPMPGLSSLPPNLRNLPALRGRGVQAAGFAGGPSAGSPGVVGTACQWIGAVDKGASTAFDTTTSGLGKLNGLGVAPDAVSSFLQEMAPMLGAISILEETGTGLSDMGIAAFVTATGDVSPTTVSYGDPPATYTVTVQSQSPFSQSDLDNFANCLEAMSPAGMASAIDSLKKIPPAGGVPNVAVTWTDTDQLDPKYGTFAPSNASVPDGLMDSLVKAGLRAMGGGTTDSNGQSKALFTPKPKKGDQQATFPHDTVIVAKVYPFPVGINPISMASNALYNRSIPIGLTVKVGLSDFTMTVTWNSRIQTPMPVYFTTQGSATVTIHVDPTDYSFHAKGTGTTTVSMPSQVDLQTGPGTGTCSAPGAAVPVDIAVDGQLKSFNTLQADVHIKITPRQTTAPVKITCTVETMGYGSTSSRSTTARLAPSVTEGTDLENMTMVLQNESDSVSIARAVGPYQESGSARVELTEINPQ